MAYATSNIERDQAKQQVLQRIARGGRVSNCGREQYGISNLTVHARFCAAGRGHFKFNINPNTLRADFELWICGSPDQYYLIPISVMRSIYDHPDSYPDRHHPEIRVVTVDNSAHRVMYAAPSITTSLRPYFRAVLDGQP